MCKEEKHGILLDVVIDRSKGHRSDVKSLRSYSNKGQEPFTVQRKWASLLMPR